MTKKLDEYTKEELIETVKLLKKRKKFGLVWEETKEEIVNQCQEMLPVLKEVSDRCIQNNPDESTSLIIEGDNYHSLSVLNYTHAGKIDIIYIDPPYNTGAKDWLYNNDYVDSNDTWRHSKWLSFMSKRLKLAKDLLKDSGVLICTIDKNEQANLGVLLEEMFGGKEIVCVTIVHNPGGIQGKNFSHTNEYAYFIYPAEGTHITTTSRDDVPITAFRDWGKESSKRTAAKTCFYPIFVKNDAIIGFGDICEDNFHPKSSNEMTSDGTVCVYPVDESGVERKWRFGRSTVEDIRNELICKKIRGQYTIMRAKTDFRWKTVWTDKKYNANVYGTKLLGNIIGSGFAYPKSVYAVMDCIKAAVHDKNGAIILDFFAGSGTTGHAVMNLNKEDGGHRKYILCTNNENGIAEKITYERIKKVSEGYGLEESMPSNIRYFKTEFVNKEKTDDQTRLSLVDRCSDMIRIREDAYNLLIDEKEFKLYSGIDHNAAIMFNPHAIEECIRKIEEIDSEKPLNIYIFSYSNYAYEEDVPETKLKYTIKPIPESILEVYKRIFKENDNV